jgi:3-hydroxypropanoate dehydrogenase
MSDLLPGQQEAIAEVHATRHSIQRADQNTMNLILAKAHTHNAWSDKEVPQALLHEAYDLAKMGPTGLNMQPMRMSFLTGEAKTNRLIPLLAEGNQSKSLAAPVTAILANDQAFYKNMSKVFPIMPGIEEMYANNAALAHENAERNGTLQAAYFMLALRSVGLDVAPMSGFDMDAVNKEFFEGTQVTANFIVNIGYGEAAGVFPRLPRLSFEEVSDCIS